MFFIRNVIGISRVPEYVFVVCPIIILSFESLVNVFFMWIILLSRSIFDLSSARISPILAPVYKANFIISEYVS